MPNRGPSMGMRLAHLYLRRTWLAKVKTATLESMRADNCVSPPKRVRREHAVLTEDIAGVRCVWLDKHKAATGVMVYLHGGAYLFGPFKEQWVWMSYIARKLGMACVMVDYRLAPEHPFPAALDDAVGVIRYLSSQGVLRSGRWVIAGDSAGGGLAVATAMQLRDQRAPLPDRLLLLSPWLDVTLSHGDIPAIAPRDPMIWFEGTQMVGTAYAGEHDPKSPLVSPVYGDPTGLPAILMQGGSAEILAPDLRLFHTQCQQAGVQITYEEYRGAFHVFPMALLMLPESRRAMRRELRFLRAMTSKPVPVENDA